MAGKAGRSGRPRGSISRFGNPVAYCGHHLNVRIEAWLARAPERRFTVPPKKKRDLACEAIRQVLDILIELEGLDGLEEPEVLFVSVDEVLAWSRRQAPAVSLRRKRS